jgi:uncharacterized membrane protein
MAQKPVQRAEVYARALHASQNVKRAEVWVGARCALRVGGAFEILVIIKFYVNIHFDNLKITFMLIARASRPNKQREVM